MLAGTVRKIGRQLYDLGTPIDGLSDAISSHAGFNHMVNEFGRSRLLDLLTDGWRAGAICKKMRGK